MLCHFGIGCSELSETVCYCIGILIIYYRGYSATDVDTGAELQIVSGENGRVTCIIPSNYRGMVSIRFKEPIYWRIAEDISFIGLLWLLICYLNKGNHMHSGRNKSEYS